MNNAGAGWLGAGVGALWIALGAGAALAEQALGFGVVTLVDKASLALAGVLVGAAAGTALFLTARSRGHRTGLLLGHLLLVPPAIQLGMTAGGAAAGAVALYSPLAAAPVYVVVLALVALSVALAGSMAGLAVQGASARTVALLFEAIGLPVPRIRLPATRRVILLLAALGGTCVYAAHKLGYLDRVPEDSAWIEREKETFSKVVAARAVDAFVLPVQAEGASFDRIERSLMTRYLARHVERGGLQVSEPTLLARALGARARQIDLKDALALAEKAGAKTVLESRVSRKGQDFDFSVRLWRRSGSGWQEAAAGALSGLPWSDTESASSALRASLDTLALQLKLAVARAGPAGEPSQPASLDDLAAIADQRGGTPEERAWRLQLLGALYARETLEAETLWERSLVALEDAALSAERKLLAARAYLHLSRRPLALEALGEPATTGERFLRAVLDGDAPSAERQIGAIANRVERLIAEIELADLHHAHGLDARIQTRRLPLLKEPDPALRAALRMRLSHPDWFATDIHSQVAQFVAPSRDLLRDAVNLLAPWIAWLYWMSDPLQEHDLRLAAGIERAQSKHWSLQAVEWAALRAADRPAIWDYYDLLYALNRYAASKTVFAMLYNQGLNDQALAAAEALAGGPFQGHPRMTYYVASALDRIGRNLEPHKAHRLFERSSALAAAVYRWEGGETNTSWPAEQLTFGHKYERYDDEPLRWYRLREVPNAREYLDRINFMQKEMEHHVAVDRRRLLYSDRYATPLVDLSGWLRRSGEADAAAAEALAQRHRFVGSAIRADLLAAVAEARGSGDPLPYYRELIELESWTARWRLAAALTESGKAREAQALFLDYPPFKQPAGRPDIVRLANVAFEAGDFFYRIGEAELAMPLFRLSSSMRTGSSRGMQSDEILALHGDGVEAAMSHARAQVQRYQDAAAGMRLVTYLSLLGRADEAQALLVDFLNRFDDEAVWTAAFIAHRLNGLEGEAAEKWLDRAAAATGRRSYFNGALRERHSFMLALLDRRPGAPALEHVRRVARANNNSPFYTSIAEGYIALHAGQYALAVARLRPPFDDLSAISVTRRANLVELLPHMVFAYSRGGNRTEADKLLAAHGSLVGMDSDFLIARALLEGADGKHEAAAESLRRAFYRLQPHGARTFFPGYVLLESCEMLLKESGERRYRELIVDFAQRMNLKLPLSWAATYAAQYSSEPEARQLAIAAAYGLDPNSPRLAGIERPEMSSLRQIMARQSGLLGAVNRARK